MAGRRVNRRGRAPSRSPGRATIWENISVEHPHGTAGEEVFTDLTPEPMATALIGTATLIRSIMNFRYGADAVGTSSVVQQVGLGITVMTNDAMAGTALPDPLTGDFQQAWFYWTVRQITLQSTSVPREQFWDADIRSARKLRGGFKLVIISESVSTNDIDTSLFINMRNLWQITS